jgi:uncharacterized C2H2 Zn-finger protein
MIKKGEHFIRFPTSGRVIVISKDDKKINCSHENKILYAERDGYRYFWCNDCHNLIREELPKEQKMSVLKKIKNKLKR